MSKKRVDSFSVGQRPREEIEYDLEVVKRQINSQKPMDEDSIPAYQNWLKEQQVKLARLEQELADHIDVDLGEPDYVSRDVRDVV
jgi:hypothetical protein